ncbi:MAG TPA: Hpt domain-containing protein [Gammaproteobacteria bacterium]|nr:Hpt domain-containing protein [Gammaproteobacteria bacterium]
MLAEDLPQQLQAFRNALIAGDLVGAAQVVHAIRGSASFCRLGELSFAATALEESLQKSRAEESLVAVFEARIEDVLAMLDNDNE